MVRAWYMDTSTDDQRLPHMTDPPQFLDIADIQSRTRVEYYQIDADNFATNSTLQTLRKERGYDYEDSICVTEQMPQYEEKIKSFYEEHLHTDEEIRLILDGSGYFDVRDDQDRWIRIEVVKGDLLILPAGIYHRFTLDAKNYIKANRYFTGVPVWTPVNRSPESDVTDARKNYMQAMLKAH